MNKTNFYKTLVVLLSLFLNHFIVEPKLQADQPNIIVILVDDVGYGDLECFGGTRSKTPNLNDMAKNGVKLTSFYTHPVCGVTRASFLTGCYAIRVAEVNNEKHFHPKLHPQEITLAETLKEVGYHTALIGKWHLAGDQFKQEHMPNAQGFDYFFGSPSHNGISRDIDGSGFRMKLMRQNKILDHAIDQQEMDQITKQYTEEAIQYIKQKKNQPFFLYLAHNMAHVVLGASEQFKGKSKGGLYGDTMEEIDWSVGQILKTLKDEKIDEKTMVLFTSDNGPWEQHHLKGKGGNDTHYGSSGPLRGFKLTTWEGGVRVPTIFQWKGKSHPGAETSEPVTIMDLFTTFNIACGASIPKDRKIDGKDIKPILCGHQNAKSPHEAIYHYAYTHLQAVRSGKWKLILKRPARPKWTMWCAPLQKEKIPEHELYNLEDDISENNNIASKHPEIVKSLLELAEKGRKDMGDYNLVGENARFYDRTPIRPRVKEWSGK